MGRNLVKFKKKVDDSSLLFSNVLNIEIDLMFLKRPIKIYHNSRNISHGPFVFKLW